LQKIPKGVYLVLNEIGRLDDLLEFSEVLAVGHDVGLSATVCENCEVSQAGLDL